MKVAVGSLNPVKLEAVENAFKAVFPDEKFEVEGVSVSSEVSDQPKHDEETILGAFNRAKKAIQQLNADYGVGLEGGLNEVSGHWLETGWCVVVDKNGNEGIGSSIRLEVAKKVMDLINEGKELGDATDILFNKNNSKQQEGFMGIMTANHVTREKAYRDGVFAALARFIQPKLFEN